ncbi:hypothetical protein QU617_00170 [Pseudomonas guariconensis]|nr:hypothetical protein [Pseudomonas guariconensis]MDM9604560.1 hypothetical protein [Pseudomonas guariconensis]MDM9609517.1 hypothetical protein [Pseudomonas guariconensis]
MDVYKLRIEDTESKIIDKEGFEAETFRRDPWYQPGSAGKLAQFAVCPACDNPVQLVGLYELLRIPRHPATQSALIWPGIPRPSGHLFHGHPAGQSERSDTGGALLA